MALYQVGQRFKDKEVDEVISILAVAPDKDFEGIQTYFVEVNDKNVNGESIKYYSSYFEETIIEWFVEVK